MGREENKRGNEKREKEGKKEDTYVCAYALSILLLLPLYSPRAGRQ